MTRGTFYIITDTEIIQSNNFNGDMYPSGYGVQALNALAKVREVDEFISMITEFNNSAHKYTNEGFLDTYSQEYSKGYICLDDNYYEKDKLDFFSDWLFFKNLSTRTVTFICKDDSIVQVEPGGTYWFYFGNDGMKHIY